jgi:putative transposase
MPKSRHTEAQMLTALQQVDAGRTAADVGREMGVSAATIYAWKAKYGGMNVSEAQEAKQLRNENARLKKMLADVMLDKDMLQAVIRKNVWSAAGLQQEFREFRSAQMHPAFLWASPGHNENSRAAVLDNGCGL